MVIRIITLLHTHREAFDVEVLNREDLFRFLYLKKFFFINILIKSMQSIRNCREFTDLN